MKVLSQISFCWTDLTSLPSRAVTTAMALTLLAITTAMVASFGLAIGSGRVNADRLARDPLSGCVLVGDEIRTQSQLTPEKLNEFETRLRTQFTEADPIIGVFGFRSVSLVILHQETNRPWELYGRTASTPRAKAVEVEPSPLREDPLLTSLATPNKRSDARVPAFVVSKRFADFCGIRGTPPVTVRVLKDDIPLPLTITNVVDSLPYKWDFILADEIYHDLELAVRRSRKEVEEVSTGTAPKHWWPILANIGDGRGEHFVRLQELARFQGRRLAGYAWEPETHRLTLAMEKTPLRVWQIFLREWADKLPKPSMDDAEFGNAVEAFLQLETFETFDETVTKIDHDMAGIFVRDLVAMRGVADFADVEPMFRGLVDRESAKKVERADEQTRTAIQIVFSFALVIILVGIIGFSTICFMRAKEKAIEAGMLRVIGYSNQMIRRFRLIESVMIWVPSVLGIPMGFLLGRLISGWKYDGDFQAQQLGYFLPPTYAVVIVLGTLVASTIIVALSSSLSNRSDPITLLTK